MNARRDSDPPYRTYFMVDEKKNLDPSADHISKDEASKNEKLAAAIAEYEQAKQIDLKNPAIAGLLTWFLPGAGHYYQGRYVKATIFFLCIVPTFVIGCILGSNSEVGWARNVYCSWRPQDKRLAFIPQACLGMAAIPAGLQALQLKAGHPPLFGRFMAPPKVDEGDPTGVEPTTAEIISQLHYLIELGKYLTILAGLMNLLAIFDAMDGPLVYRPEEEDTEEKSDET